MLKRDPPKHDDIIRRDLNRTFPRHEVFRESNGLGQQQLYNVLKAFAIYDEVIGYCQGMAFIVAILLTYMSEEVRKANNSIHPFFLKTNKNTRNEPRG